MSGKVIEDIRKRMADTRDAADEYANGYRRKAEHTLHDLTSTHQVQEGSHQLSKVLSKAEQTPDSAYLGAMAASMVLSLLLLGRKNKALALFVGLWPVTIVNIALMLKKRRPSREIQQPAGTPAGVDGLLLAE